jgi:hypothetical protein
MDLEEIKPWNRFKQEENGTGKGNQYVRCISNE